MNLAEIVSTQKSIKDEAGPEKKELEADEQEEHGGGHGGPEGRTGGVHAVTKRYDELNTDASVRKALVKLEKDKVGTFKLGPSTTFKTAVKLENAERTILAKRTTAVSRKEGKIEAVIVRGPEFARRNEPIGVESGSRRPSPVAAEARAAYQDVPGPIGPDGGIGGSVIGADGPGSGPGDGSGLGSGSVPERKAGAIKADGNRRRSSAIRSDTRT